MIATPDQTPPPNRKVIATMTVPLKCMLTPHEVGKKQASLLECHRKLRSHEQHEANVKAQLKRDRTAIESEMGAVVGVLESGYEMRDTVVEKIADYEAGLVRHIRVDTGDEVDVERMSEAQKQTELDLREKRDAEASRPTNPDDVAPDGDPWGAPSDGRPPVADLPHDPDVIDAEFVEGDGLDGDEPADDDADPETSGEGAAAAPTSVAPPAAPDRSGWMSAADENAAGELVVWMRGIGADKATEHLESCGVDELRDIYRYLTDDATQQRAQKRTLIPKIIETLFQAVPF